MLYSRIFVPSRIDTRLREGLSSSLRQLPPSRITPSQHSRCPFLPPFPLRDIPRGFACYPLISPTSTQTVSNITSKQERAPCLDLGQLVCLCTNSHRSLRRIIPQPPPWKRAVPQPYPLRLTTLSRFHLLSACIRIRIWIDRSNIWLDWRYSVHRCSRIGNCNGRDFWNIRTMLVHSTR